MHSYPKNAAAVLLLVGVLVPQLFLLLPAKRAHAISSGSVVETIELPAGVEAIKDYILDMIPRLIVEALVRSLTDSIVSWIQNGEPNFVQNIEDELTRTADSATGKFLTGLTGINLCGDLSPFLQITLRFGLPRGPKHLQMFRCSLTRIVGNVNHFYQDFQQGGWSAFIESNVRTQNTAYGSYFMAIDTKSLWERRVQNRLKEEYKAGQGFLGVKQCEDVVDADVDGNEFTTKKCDTVTPGVAVTGSLNKALGSDFDFSYATDEINELVTAVARALVSKVINSGSGLLSFGGNRPIVSDPAGISYSQSGPNLTRGPLSVTPTGFLLTVHCGPDKDFANTGEAVTWRALASGGSGTKFYTWSGDVTGSSAAARMVYTTAGVKRGSVTVRDSGGSTTADCTPTVLVEDPNQPPAITLSSNTNHIPSLSGGPVLLTWNVVNRPASCTAGSAPAGSWSGSKAFSGTQTATITQTTTFTLSCTGTNGVTTSQSRRVWVGPPPPPPAQPIFLSVAPLCTNDGYGNFVFDGTFAQWTGRDNDVTYSVLRCSGAACTPNTSLVSNLTTMEFTDLDTASIPGGTTLRYAIQAHRAIDNTFSLPSNRLDAVAGSCASRAAIFSVTPEIGEFPFDVTMQWDVTALAAITSVEITKEVPFTPEAILSTARSGTITDTVDVPGLITYRFYDTTGGTRTLLRTVTVSSHWPP